MKKTFGYAEVDADVPPRWYTDKAGYGFGFLIFRVYDGYDG